LLRPMRFRHLHTGQVFHVGDWGPTKTWRWLKDAEGQNYHLVKERENWLQQAATQIGALNAIGKKTKKKNSWLIQNHLTQIQQLFSDYLRCSLGQLTKVRRPKGTKIQKKPFDWF
jgi:hypothetical protein